MNLNQIYAMGSWALPKEHLPIFFAIIAAVVGFVVSNLIVYILDSAVAMVYVSYAEDPDALKVIIPWCEIFHSSFET